MRSWRRSMNKRRIILDTNILISYMLKPSAGMAHVVSIALESGCLLFSQDTFDELRHVIERFVRRAFISVQESSEFLGSMVDVAEWVPIMERVKACRDPKDDMFLELAVNGRADYLITGDKDLLVLHPFSDTQILSPNDFISSVLS